MRNLTQRETAAMWLYHEEYASQSLGAIEFYDQLSPYRKENIDRMIKEICEAPTTRRLKQEVCAGCRDGYEMHPDGVHHVTTRGKLFPCKVAAQKSEAPK